MKSKQYYIKKFDRFVNGVSQADRIAIIYHTDADGFCSALLVCKALSQLGISKALVFNQGHEIAISKKTLRRAREGRINKAIFADLCVDQEPGPFRKLEKFCSTLILDHHKLYNDLNSKRTLMIKGQFVSRTEPSAYPASKLAFDLFSRHAELRPYAWIAAIGILGDMGMKRWRGFIASAARQKNLKMRDLHALCGLIGAVEAVSPKSFPKLFREFMAVEKPRALLKSRLWKHARKFRAELKKHLSAVKKKAEFYPRAELVFYKIKSRCEIKSALINRMSSEMFPNKTVVVVQDNAAVC